MTRRAQRAEDVGHAAGVPVLLTALPNSTAAGDW